MNAQELFLKDGSSAGVFACQNCKTICYSLDSANRCCAPSQCQSCGKPAPHRAFRLCDDCQESEEIIREQERLTKAEKVTHWDGPVYCEGYGNDGFFPSLNDLLDDLAHLDPNDRPTYAWTCHTNQFVKATVDDVINAFSDQAYPDFDSDDLAGIPQLQEALTAFQKANQHHVTFTINYKQAILIPNNLDASKTPDTAK